MPVDQGVVQSMRDVDGFRAGLGKEKNYSNYLAFFQGEIGVKGVGDVLGEYLFAGDERAETMLCRLFGGTYILIYPYPVQLCRLQANGFRSGSPAYPSLLWIGVQSACHCGSGFGSGGCA